MMILLNDCSDAVPTLIPRGRGGAFRPTHSLPAQTEPAPPLMPRAAATALPGRPGATGERLSRFFLPACCGAPGCPLPASPEPSPTRLAGSSLPDTASGQRAPRHHAQHLRLPELRGGLVREQLPAFGAGGRVLQHGEGQLGSSPGGGGCGQSLTRPGFKAWRLHVLAGESCLSGSPLWASVCSCARRGALAFIHDLSLFGIRLCGRLWKGSHDPEKSDSRHSQPGVMLQSWGTHRQLPGGGVPEVAPKASRDGRVREGCLEEVTVAALF